MTITPTQVEDWLDSLREAEEQAVAEADRSGAYGVLELRTDDADPTVKIGLHTSVPAGTVHYRRREPPRGQWLEKTVRRFVPPWTISHRAPSIYPG